MPSDLTGGDAVHEVVAAHEWETPINPRSKRPMWSQRCKHCDIWRTNWSETTDCPQADGDIEAETPAVHEAVAAVLEHWPVDHEGDCVIGFEPTVTDEHGQVVESAPVYGDARPIAARQTAAAYRSAADRASSTLVGDEAFRVYTWLRALADEIDPQEVADHG